MSIPGFRDTPETARQEAARLRRAAAHQRKMAAVAKSDHIREHYLAAAADSDERAKHFEQKARGEAR